MPDKDNDAYWKGVSDRQSYDSKGSIDKLLGDVTDSNYNPPKGSESAYKAGFTSKDRK